MCSIIEASQCHHQHTLRLRNKPPKNVNVLARNGYSLTGRHMIITTLPFKGLGSLKIQPFSTSLFFHLSISSIIYKVIVKVYFLGVIISQLINFAHFFFLADIGAFKIEHAILKLVSDIKSWVLLKRKSLS